MSSVMYDTLKCDFCHKFVAIKYENLIKYIIKALGKPRYVDFFVN